MDFRTTSKSASDRILNQAASTLQIFSRQWLRSSENVSGYWCRITLNNHDSDQNVRCLPFAAYSFYNSSGARSLIPLEGGRKLTWNLSKTLEK